MARRGVRVDSEGWVHAAHQQLISLGPAAVSVEGIAGLLGVTKGSFYWYFPNRDALLGAALHRWEDEQTQALIDEANTADRPEERVRILFTRVSSYTVAMRGEAAMYTAAASGTEPTISQALQRVSESRIAYVASLLEQLGCDSVGARDRARLALAMVIGQRTLAMAVPDLAASGPARQRAVELAIAIFTRR